MMFQALLSLMLLTHRLHAAEGSLAETRRVLSAPLSMPEAELDDLEARAQCFLDQIANQRKENARSRHVEFINGLKDKVLTQVARWEPRYNQVRLELTIDGQKVLFKPTANEGEFAHVSGGPKNFFRQDWYRYHTVKLDQLDSQHPTIRCSQKHEYQKERFETWVERTWVEVPGYAVTRQMPVGEHDGHWEDVNMSRSLGWFTEVEEINAIDYTYDVTTGTWSAKSQSGDLLRKAGGIEQGQDLTFYILQEGTIR